MLSAESTPWSDTNATAARSNGAMDSPFLPASDGTPPNFEILGTAPARWHPDDCQWYERWENGREGHAVLGVYQRGGTVVTTGSTDWVHGLRGGDAAVERITRNVIDRLSR